jgi:hypothetical protein
MIPEYCFDCMNRQQIPMGPYGQPMPGYYPMPQTGQIPMDTMQQMQPGMGGQFYPQFPTMQPGVTAQPMEQFPTMQPGMAAQPGVPVEGGPSLGFEPGTPVETDINYTQAYLKTKIGQRVKIEFLIGTNMLIDREGTLLEVGISYVIIREVETDDDLLCDIYSIKFVRFYY